MLKSSADFMFDTLPKTHEEFIKLLESHGFTTSEIEPILKAQGKQMILATVGAGKSTVLQLKYIYDKLFGTLNNEKYPEDKDKSILISTFLSSGSDDLKRGLLHQMHKLDLQTIGVSKVSFKTMHSEMLALLKMCKVDAPILDSKPDLRMRILKKLVRDYDICRYPEFPTNQELNVLTSIMSKYRNIVKSEFTFGSEDEEALEMGINLDNLPLLVKDYEYLRRVKNRVMDYDDMLEIVYKNFVNPETRQEPLYSFYINRYRYVMIDEFQDTSELQYEILKPILEHAKTSIVVGDDDQSIYSFRGASAKVMFEYKDDFDPVVLPLSVSYRCPSNILNPMRTLIEHNPERFDKNIKSFKEGGIVESLSFTSVTNMVLRTLDIIENSVQSNKDIAVLSRTNRMLSPIVVAYILRYGASFRLLGSEYTLNNAIYKNVWSFANLFEGRGVESFSTILRVLDPTISRAIATNIESSLKNTIKKDESVMFYWQSIIDALHTYRAGLGKQVQRFFDFLLEVNKNGVVKHISVLTAIFNYLKTEASSNFEIYDTLIYLAQVSENISDFKTNISHVNNVISEAKNSSNRTVTFSTPHGFKGKQADVVVVFNASVGVFPSPLSTKDNEDEERRNFYIVGTRAIKEQYYLSLTGNPSPYLIETGLPITSVSSVNLDNDFERVITEMRKRVEEETKEDDLFTWS